MDKNNKNPESKVWHLKHTSHVTMANASSKHLAVFFFSIDFERCQTHSLLSSTIGKFYYKDKPTQQACFPLTFRHNWTSLQNVRVQIPTLPFSDFSVSMLLGRCYIKEQQKVPMLVLPMEVWVPFQLHRVLLNPKLSIQTLKLQSYKISCSLRHGHSICAFYGQYVV